YSYLAYSLLRPREGWGFGLGHASFLVRNMARLTGDDDALLLSKVYRMQIEDGTPATAWYTAYMWMASDTTYAGSIIAFFLIGYVFAAAWRAVLQEYNIFAISAVIWIWTGLFLVHNALVVTDYAAWIGVFGSFLMFAASRKRSAVPGNPVLARLRH